VSLRHAPTALTFKPNRKGVKTMQATMTMQQFHEQLQTPTGRPGSNPLVTALRQLTTLDVKRVVVLTSEGDLQWALGRKADCAA
jgi:hypothetical protein